MGWTETRSWLEQGCYVSTSPGGKLMALLEPYLMNPAKWLEKIR